MEKKTAEFKTEVSELLHLIIHSLYSHPEIFLRELISNSSDAIDKLRLESQTQSDLIPDNYEPFIRLEADKENRILKVIDNGIGMTAEEIEENLGRIAHSGTRQFMKLRKEMADNPELIGQFGVGFYSAFMVADKIKVETRKAGEAEAVCWESDGHGSYELEACEREDVGTTITLHLKETDKEEVPDFSEEWTLRSTVKKYSDYISYPIKMEIEREESAGEEGDSTTETVIEDQVLNSQKAIWLKPAKDVEEVEYNDFYSHLTNDYTPPLDKLHFKAEGTQEFSALLYLPGGKPFNYDYEAAEKGLTLYVKRVLIMPDCEELIPLYFRFMKGVVDSSDLNLNVSREILQHSRQLMHIKKALTNKIIKFLADTLKKDREKYEKFWTNFGPTLKEGPIREPEKQDKLLPLCLFNSTESDKLTTLDEYIARMKEGQPAVYYMIGESLNEMRVSPYIEQLKEKDYEVLFLTDPIDEFFGQRLEKYQEKKIQDIAATDLELDSEEEKKEKEEKLKEKENYFQPLLEVMKGALKEDLKDVKVSSRLKDSPVCLVADEGAIPHQMLEMYRQMGQEIPEIQRVMEINPEHPLFDRMLLLGESQQQEWSKLLYDQALIAEGSKIQDPAEFVRKISALMMDSAA